jgi:hypothetical protein
MIWLFLLVLVALILVLFGCWLTMSRVRKYREAAESNRVRAFAEMERLAKEKRDTGTRGRGETTTGRRGD